LSRKPSEGAAAAGGVEAVDRALAILRTFDVGHERQTLTELATRTGFYKSTILRLARSLETAGYITREEGGGAFTLGAEPMRLAAVYRRGAALEASVRPVLRLLRDETGESASFFRRQGDWRQCLYREETRRAIRDHLMEGDVLPLNIGAGGRVLREFGDAAGPEAWAQRYAELPYVSFGERDPETAAVSAPVFGHGALLGAISISGPRTRITPERAPEIGQRLMQRAEGLSRLLGGPDLAAERTVEPAA